MASIFVSSFFHSYDSISSHPFHHHGRSQASATTTHTANIPHEKLWQHFALNWLSSLQKRDIQSEIGLYAVQKMIDIFFGVQCSCRAFVYLLLLLMNETHCWQELMKNLFSCCVGTVAALLVLIGLTTHHTVCLMGVVVGKERKKQPNNNNAN